MYLNWFLFTILFSFIEAQYPAYYPYYRGSDHACMSATLNHGRVRLRQRFKLVKFTCNYRYELVGNRYGTCRNGQWDTPFPVCVKPGCDPMPDIENAIPMVSHRGAWVVVFCLPGHKLVGSSAVYCDGYNWNATFPTCVDSTVKMQYSCNFEDENLCGWTQDELHDFDWTRLNEKTPSTFLKTGPSFDHTLGPNGTGYYMYIESTSRLENDTARLISPIYDVSMSQDGCFQFFYHMFGKRTGGLRVYQKPEYLQVAKLLTMDITEKQKYILFELWGNQGDAWYSAVPQLRNFNDSFQIIIEGIRGKSFTSDIAIDDVAILQGANCTDARSNTIAPPTTASDSCIGRCDYTGERIVVNGCGCSLSCLADNDCCMDFIELCVFNSNASKSDDDVNTTVNDKPVTEPKTPTTETTKTTPTTSTTPSTPKFETTTKSTIRTTTTKITTLKTTTTKRTTPSTTATFKTTSKPTTISTTTRKPTTTTTRKPSTSSTSTRKPSTPKTLRTTTTLKTKTTKTTPTTKPPTTSTTTIKITQTGTTSRITKALITSSEVTPILLTTETTRDVKAIKADSKGHSNASLIAGVIVGVICIALFGINLVWIMRKVFIVNRLRGRVSNDPEVRYLTASVEE